MSSVHFEELVTNSVDSVLETMFFSAQFGPAGERPNREDSWGASLGFHGDIAGGFGIQISRPSAQLLAASFLGQDEKEVPEEQVGEVVCELANMLCGSVVSRLEGADHIELTSPTLIRPEGITGDDLDYAHFACFELESGILSVGLRVERSA